MIRLFATTGSKANAFSATNGQPVQPSSFSTIKRVLVMLMALLITGTAAIAQTHTPIPKQGNRLGYWEFLPEGYHGSGKKYPLMIFLHGLGETGNGSVNALQKILRAGPPKEIHREGSDMTFTVNGKTHSFLVMSPQIGGGWWAEKDLDVFIDYVVQNYRVDPERIYLTGLSLGGGGTWAYATGAYNKDDNRFAAIAPVAGFGNAGKTCNLAKYNVPVWAFHNRGDGTVTYAKGKAMVDAYNACRPAPSPRAKMTVYESNSHDSWTNAYETDHRVHNPNLYEWLLQHTLPGGNRQTNQPPVVNAGQDITVTLPTNKVDLNGSANDPDGSISYVKWEKISGPNAKIANPGRNNTKVEELKVGTYTFRFTAGDDKGATATDEVKVTVKPEPRQNQGPVVNAGQDITITLPTNKADLSGSATDQDGNIAWISWEKVSGPNARIVNPGQAQTRVENLAQGTYVFRIKAADNDGATATDEVKVTVKPEPRQNQGPVVNAGQDITITLPTNKADLSGSATDQDGNIAWISWEKVSGPNARIVNPGQAQTRVENLAQGTYVFRIKAADNDGATATDEVKVTVKPEPRQNQGPVVNAGQDITITLPTNKADLSGSATDQDGNIAWISWEKVSGPNARIVNPGQAQTRVENLAQGTYVFRIKAADNDGATATDEVKVTVKPEPRQNQGPVVNAGQDITITLPTNKADLSGSATDQDGNIAWISWEKVSGPNARIVNPGQAQTRVENLAQGTYVFRIKAADNDGAKATDEVTVTVKAEPKQNQGPVVNAGQDITITLPTNKADLRGSATDQDGNIAWIAWEKVSGPNARIVTPGRAHTRIENLTQGTYVFRMKAGDNDGAKATDEVTVTVKAEPKQNQGPVVNAGQDITITLPTNKAELRGSATDQDGHIAWIAWEKVSGPNARIVTPGRAHTRIENLTQGTYVFRMKAGDNDGARGSDEVTVTVKAKVRQPNKGPVANAGTDKTLTLPTNATALSGQGNDTDGQISAYWWKKVSGPQATLADQDKATLKLSSLVQGRYVFELIVTDNEGAKGTDRVNVTVNAAPQQPNASPVASAGQDKTITLPQNYLTLRGSGNDEDGQVEAYWWKKVSGPAATLDRQNQSTLELSNLVQGQYVFELIVTDNKGAKGTDKVSVTVKPQPRTANELPVVSAGNDRMVPEGAGRVIISAFASDSDGEIVQYEWSQVAGQDISLTNHFTPRLHLLSPEEGSYAFKVTVTDNKGGTASDEVRVTVSGVIVETAPIVWAGEDQVLTGPQEYLLLKGKAEPGESGAEIVSYEWAQAEGPVTTMSFTNSYAAEVRNLLPGEYTFSLRVIDANGLEGTDEVHVSVNGELSEESLSNTFNLFENLNNMAGARLYILDSSGKTVHSWENYQNDWDGRSGSIGIPEGTYFFIVTLRGAGKKISGSVLIDNK
ncbi:Ig-like domain-containing protein [Roseivirga sp. BDSF3-8]|uniref:PKD domain-containing protein n=1 Tax=Roseivirga sp. BDSF3-8 TaxID=3241598 RepID=UPI00353204CE